jgi:diacylglycerol kinase (ATP)
MRRWAQATRNSWKGLQVCFATEAAFRQEVLLIAVAIPLAWLIGAGPWQRLALISPILLLLILELFNTAIEKLCDRISPQHDPVIGSIKDMGSAAIGLTLFGTIVVWGLALSEWLGAQWAK